MTLFKAVRALGASELALEYERRGLVPADAYSLAAINRDDPRLSDRKTNSTHWLGPNGEVRAITFGNMAVLRSDDRYVSVHTLINGGAGYGIWLGGIAKKNV